LANGESKWITSEAARVDVHRWRARSGALLTGSGTVLADDPQLTVRLPESIDYLPPLRVLLDSHGKVTANARIFSLEAPTLAVHAADIVPRYQEGIEAIAVPRHDGRLDLQAMLAQLAQRNVNEVQVEAGATLSGGLLKAGLVDELLLYVAPVVLGDRARPLFAGLDIANMSERLGFRLIESVAVGPDLRLLLRP
jgi:diaminohydroxyphosphoribosylaminopyrimidine deaminase/5-amino-6-(5-phosphoribosylamino)uracil reductase